MNINRSISLPMSSLLLLGASSPTSLPSRQAPSATDAGLRLFEMIQLAKEWILCFGEGGGKVSCGRLRFVSAVRAKKDAFKNISPKSPQDKH